LSSYYCKQLMLNRIRVVARPGIEPGTQGFSVL
jgi:hypothetical protein